MKLNFAMISQPLSTSGGTSGTRGTALNHGLCDVPPHSEVVGHVGRELPDPSHLSHDTGEVVGRRKASVHAVVPPVPPVPPENKANNLSDWQVALMTEFMEVDGLSREEAEAMALISVQPRSPAAWTALLAELDEAIEAYCVAYSVPEAQREQIRGARSRQSVATLQETLDWFYGQIDIAAGDAHRRATQGRGTVESLAV